MRIKYKGLDDNTYSQDLKEIKVTGVLLHTTPDDNLESIKRQGLKTKMPRTKLMVDVDAIFCTIPSERPNTSDLFRYYDDWCIVVIDTAKIPNHKWYIDFLAEADASNNGKNKHVMTFGDIPVSANIVFLNGAAFDPQPPLGTGEDTRYIKLKTIEELNDPLVAKFIQQAGTFNGWQCT